MSKKTNSTVKEGHCPNCGADIKADVVAQFNDRWSTEDVSGDDYHRILRCRGCERVYFQTAAFFSEDDPSGGPTITHWPPEAKRKEPKWLLQLTLRDRELRSLFRETYSALNGQSHVLTAIGLRTIFDYSSEKLGVDPDLSFRDKLNELVQLGKIGADEKTTLDILTDAGSAAVHRGWRPSDEQLDTMFDIIEGFVHRAFFVHRAANELKATVPPRLAGKQQPTKPKAP